MSKNHRNTGDRFVDDTRRLDLIPHIRLPRHLPQNLVALELNRRDLVLIAYVWRRQRLPTDAGYWLGYSAAEYADTEARLPDFSRRGPLVFTEGDHEFSKVGTTCFHGWGPGVFMMGTTQFQWSP